MAEGKNYELQQIGSRIKEVRRERGMSQADLAAKADISMPHVSEIELGKTSMRLSSFIRIVEALEVSSDYLIRANVPDVKSIYYAEFEEIVSDCSPAELDSILQIVKQVKSTMHKSEEA